MVGVATVVWSVAVLSLFGVLPLAGTLPLDLYRFYSFAGVLGWLAGNVYNLRRRQLPGGGWRKRLLFAYLVEPAGVPCLLRALAPASEQMAAPFVPLYGFGIYAIFFLVPVSLRPPARVR